MPLDFSETRVTIAQLRTNGTAFFAELSDLAESDDPFGPSQWDLPPTHYWSRLTAAQQERSFELRSELFKVVEPIANSLKFSALATEADRRDLSIWTKTARAALRLRRFDFSETEILHDEGVVLGVAQESQSENAALDPAKAIATFERHLQNMLDLIDIIEIAPELPTPQWNLNPQTTASYERDAAFVMMAFDPGDPMLEDVYNAIKTCFDDFGIAAVRADKIEHEGLITAEIRRRIQVSEFLFADLTHEKPNVYYEVGYAHALGKKVILFCRQGTQRHFDLSGYNCPEYRNVTDLKKQLHRRLTQITNKSFGHTSPTQT